MLCCYTLSIHICLIMSYLCTTRVGSWSNCKKWSFSSQILAIFLDVLTSLLLVLKQNGLKFLGCLIDAALAPYIIICQKNSSLKNLLRLKNSRRRSSKKGKKVQLYMEMTWKLLSTSFCKRNYLICVTFVTCFLLLGHTVLAWWFCEL